MNIFRFAALAAGILLLAGLLFWLTRRLLEHRTLSWQNRLLDQNVEEIRSI